MAEEAKVVEATDESSGIGDFVFGTDGKGYRNIIIDYGCARNDMPQADEIYEVTDNYGNIRHNTSFYMNGSAVFLFSAKTGPKLIKDLLNKAGLTLDDIDLVVFHQASKLIMETVARKANIPKEKYYIHIEDCGNTVSSTIPIALYHAMEDNRTKKGDTVMFVSFGVGYSWAACVLEL